MLNSSPIMELPKLPDRRGNLSVIGELAHIHLRIEQTCRPCNVSGSPPSEAYMEYCDTIYKTL